MATMVFGSKNGTFCLKENIWKCTTCLESDVLIKVTGFSFCLHKFPLINCSPVLKKLISKHSCDKSTLCTIELHDIPGGACTFEFISKFCYGERIELSSSNAVPLLCASHYLDMNENYLHGNLIPQTQKFLLDRILSSWRETIEALRSCEPVLQYAEEIGVVSKCIYSLAHKAGYGKSYNSHLQQMMYWNGICPIDETPSKLESSELSIDWWFCDISSLSLYIFKRFIGVLGDKGHDPVIISKAVIYYACKYHPGLNCNFTGKGQIDDQRIFLEEIVGLLPVEKGVTSTKFLFNVLNTSIMINANVKFIKSLEKRIKAQLEESTVEDLLLVPNLGTGKERVYEINCIQRIVEQFIKENFHVDHEAASSVKTDESLVEIDNSEQFAKIAALAKLVDEYLLKISADPMIKFQQFQSLAIAIPMDMRHSDDEFYRAIDSYIEHHPELSDEQKEQLCQLIDMQNLSEDVCRELAHNEKLPLRFMVKALFLEMHHLKSSLIEPKTDNDDIDSDEERELMTRCVKLQNEYQHLKEEMKSIKEAKLVKTTTWGSIFVTKFMIKVFVKKLCSARVVKALLVTPPSGQ